MHGPAVVVLDVLDEPMRPAEQAWMMTEMCPHQEYLVKVQTHILFQSQSLTMARSIRGERDCLIAQIFGDR